MGERRRARSRSGYRHGRRLRQARRGVVAVVGTLLALLVFFALFGIFLTQYVPLWMEENENAFSNQVQVSLATLKSGVDDQYTLGGIPGYSVPFTMSSQSVPLITQPTVATLSYLNGCPDGFYASNGTPVRIGSCDFLRLAYNTATGAAGSQTHNFNQTSPTNYLEISLPDRYYVPLDYYFEGDAVTGAQTSGHGWMVAPPPLNVTKTSSNLTVQSSFVTLLGNTSSYTSQGTKDVTSHFLSTTNVTSVHRFLSTTGAARTFNLTVTVGVHDLCGWYNFLYNETEHAFGSTSTTLWKLTASGSSGSVALPPVLSNCQLSITNTFDLELQVFNVNYAVTTIAQAQLTFNAGGL